MRIAVLIALLAGCRVASVQPARCSPVLGPRVLPQRYAVRPMATTPLGIAVDHAGVTVVSLSEIDRRARAVADCLGLHPDLTCLVVKVAADTVPSCAGPWRLLPIAGAPGSCVAKGQQPSAACPCLYRAGVQPDGAIVTEPALSNLGTPLVTVMTGVDDPWRSGPRNEQCALAGSGVTP